MKGQRREITNGSSLPDDPRPGDFWRDASGVWWVCAPRCGIGRLLNHQVVEHEDGTITVSPSILMTYTKDVTWHGYLERGVWREV